MKLSKTQINISKTISYALRHKPEEFGLTLDSEGWVDIDVFIEAFANYRQPIHISENDIKAIIDSSEKKRFEISNGKITVWGGNYDFWVAQRHIVHENMLSRYTDANKEIVRLTGTLNVAQNMCQHHNAKQKKARLRSCLFYACLFFG